MITFSYTRHTRQDSPGRVISSTQRPLPDNTQYSQEKNIHPPCGIRTQIPSKRDVVDPRLTLRGQWDRCICILVTIRIRVKLLEIQRKRSSFSKHTNCVCSSIWYFLVRFTLMVTENFTVNLLIYGVHNCYLMCQDNLTYYL